MAAAPSLRLNSKISKQALLRHAAYRENRSATETKWARRDRIVLEHLSLVKNIAFHIRETLPVHVDPDDLVHAGILGLFDAATKYDADKQVQFGSYARHRIKGAILDSLRASDPASRNLRRKHRELQAATDALAAELKRMPSDAEIAERLGMDVDLCRELMAHLRICGLLASDNGGNSDEAAEAPEFPGAPENRPDMLCASEERRIVLDKAMRNLSERYRQVLIFYYTHQMTMKEIAGILGINESRVSQIHRSALEKMNAALNRAGVYSSADV